MLGGDSVANPRDLQRLKNKKSMGKDDSYYIEGIEEEYDGYYYDDGYGNYDAEESYYYDDEWWYDDSGTTRTRLTSRRRTTSQCPRSWKLRRMPPRRRTLRT